MKLANTVANTYGSRNPFTICEELGIEILFLHLDDGLRGSINRIRGQYVVFIHDQLTEHVQYYVCAHELGHFFFHRGLNCTLFDGEYSRSKYENKADIFACQLLYGEPPLFDDPAMTYSQIADCLQTKEDKVQDKLYEYGVYPFYEE